MSRTERWYKETGWKILNEKVHKYSGKVSDLVPISNLDLGISLSGLNMAELTNLINEDGGKAIYNQAEREIYLKM